MILKLHRDLLLDAIKHPAKAVSSRSFNQVLTMLRFETDGTNLYVTGGDGDVQIKTSIGTIQDTGSFLIEGKQLEALVSKMPAGDISIDTTKSPAVIATGRMRYTIPIMPDTNYPQFPPQGNELLSVPARRLMDAIGQVIHCCAKLNDKIGVNYSNGVFLSCAEEHIDAVASDGGCLAVSRIDIEPGEHRFDILIPETSCHAITAALNGKDCEVKLYQHGYSFTVEIGSLTLTTSLYDVKFPDFKRVLPVNHDWYFYADQAVLLKCLERAVTVLRRKELNPAVRIVCGGGSGESQLSVLCDSGESGNGAEDVDVVVSADKAFSSLLGIYRLLDVVKILTGQIRIQGTTAASPVLVGATNFPDFQEVIMPLQED